MHARGRARRPYTVTPDNTSTHHSCIARHQQRSRQPAGRTSTASLTAHPRHTQSHTLGHWTPHSGSRSGVTQGGPNHTEERGRGGHTNTKSARRLVAPLMRDAPLPHRDMHATRSRVAQAGSHQAARHGSASPTATSPSRKSGADWHCMMHTHRHDTHAEHKARALRIHTSS